MRKMLLGVLSVIAILVTLVVPVATPVMAAAPVLSSLTVADFPPNDGHPGQTLINVAIGGTGFTSPANDNTLSFSNGNVTGAVTGITIPGTLLQAQITISGNATTASTDLTLTNSGGTSNIFTLTNFVEPHVPVFPEPIGAVTEAVGTSITPYIGGVPVAGNIHIGDVITYHVTLSMPLTGTVCYNFYGGTMAVRLPSSSTTYIHVAGFGLVGTPASPSNPTGSTPVMPEVPEITKNAFMTFALPFTYTANSADLVDTGGGVMRLVAYVDYGVPDFPDIDGGVSGTFEETVGLVGAHAGSINALAIIHPDTTANITAAANTVISGGSTTLTVTENNTGDSNLHNISVLLSGGVTGNLTKTNLLGGSFSGDTGNDTILSPGEQWVWTGISTGPLTAATTFTATGFALDLLNSPVTYPVFQNERASTTVNVSSTAVTITPAATTVISGQGTTLTVTEINNGTSGVTLINPSVILTGGLSGNLTKTTLMGGSFAGDTNGDGKLDIGETWTWSNIPTGALSASTSYTATGHGIDPSGNDVTYPAIDGERASTTVNVSSTAVTITPAATTVISGQGTTLTVTEINNGTSGVTLINPSVILTGGLSGNLTKTTLMGGSFAGDTNGDGKLDIGETWTWSNIPTGALSASTSFTATGHGIDPSGNDVTYPAIDGERASTTVNVSSTAVTITPAATTVISGQGTTLTVTEINNGTSGVTLINPSVILTGGLSGNLTKTTLMGGSFAGDTNGDGKLDIGETWTWSNIPTGALSASTSYTATGHGIDPSGNDVTYPAIDGERASTTVNVSSTAVTITPAATTVISGQGTTLTVTEINNGTSGVTLINPSVILTGGLSGNLTKTTLMGGSFAGDTNGDGKLDIGETWTWSNIPTGALSASTSFTATGHGIDPSGNDVTYPAIDGERASTTVNVSSTAVTITPAATTVISGQGTTLTVTEINNGTSGVTLINPSVILTGGLSGNLTKTTLMGGSFAGDTNGDGKLDIGETWTWSNIPTGALSASTSFTATGHGIDPSGNDVTYPAIDGERASTTVNVSSTAVTITPAATTVISGQGTTLTVTEINNGTSGVTLINPSVILTGGLSGNLTKTTLMGGSFAGDTNGDGKLDIGETWTWSNIPTGALTASTSYTATGHGIDPSGNDVTYPAIDGERASTTVNVSSTAVTITPAATTVISGQGTTLTVTEINNGTSGVTLINPSVILTGGLSGNLTKTTLMGGSFAGDTNGDGKLDIGETWTWSNIPTGALSASTSYTATGHGIDPSGNDVTFPAVAGERASTTVNVSSTAVTITPAATTVISGQGTTLTVTEINNGTSGVTLINPSVILTGGLSGNLTKTTLMGGSFAGDTNGDGKLDIGETWTWSNIPTGALSASTSYTATGHGIDPSGNDVTFPAVAGERASTTVNVSSTAVTITPAATTVISGQGTTLTVTEINNGTSGVTLINPSVILTGGLSGNLTKTTLMGGSFAGDTNGDGKLDIGETWTWSNIPTGALSASTSYTATGHGIDPSGNDVTYPAIDGERASTTVNVSSTAVTITPAATTVISGQGTTLTVTEINNGTSGVTLINPSVILTGGLSGNLTKTTLMGGSFAGDTNGDGKLDIGETWTWSNIPTGALSASTSFTATGHGIDPSGNDVTYPAIDGERASTTVNVSSTAVTITPAATTVISGQGTTLTVTEINNGTSGVTLINPSVILTGGLSGNLTKTTLMGGSFAGDTNGDGKLDIGETWTWSNIPTGALSASTSYTATGHGIDPSGNDVTYPAIDGERASTTVNVSSTAVTITPAATTVISGQGTTLTVTEINNGTSGVTLINPSVILTGGLSGNLTKTTLMGGSFAGDTNGDGKLDIGETWTWSNIPTGALTASTSYTATGHGIDPSGNDVTYPAIDGERASTTVNVSSTAVTITPAATTVISGQGTTLTVTEINNGTSGVTLINPSVILTGGLSGNLTKTTLMGGSFAGDTNGDGKLDIGETWTWSNIPTGALSASTSYTATGHGIDPSGNDVTYPAIDGERASTTVNVSSTAVTITPAATTVISGQGTTLTVTEINNGTSGVTLINPSVILTGGLSGNLTKTTLMGGSFAGDTNGDGKLDIGETWTWSNIPTGALTASTSYTATGHGIDPSGNDVTYPAIDGERASTTVNVSSTAVTITPAATTVISGQGTTLTVTEINNGTSGVTLINPSVILTGGLSGNLTKTTLMGGSFAGDTNGDGKLDIGETWTWSNIPTGALTASTSYTATGHGIDPSGNDVTYPAIDGERASTTVNVSSTAVTITPATTTVISGQGTTLTVTEINNGTSGVTLINPSVILTGGLSGNLTKTTLMGGSFAGDTNGDGKLDIGETWTWSNIPTGALSASTSYTATGHGIDPSGNDVTYPAIDGERASTTVNVSSTAVTITPAATTVISGQGTTLTVTEINNGTSGVTLINPSVILTGGLSGNLTKTTLMGGSFAGDTNGDGKLDIGETWTWSNIPTGALSASTSYTATGHGIDPSGNDVTFPAVAGERASTTVNVSSTAVTITPAATTVISGQGTTLTVTEINNGTSGVTLINPSVILTGGLSGNLTKTTLMGGSFAGDTNGDGKLDIGETWTWSNIPTGALSASTSYTATGHGIDPSGNDVTFPAVAGERASTTVNVSSTAVTITPAATTVISGQGTTLTVTEINNGTSGVTLINPSVILTGGLSGNLTKTTLMGGSFAGDTNGDGKLDIGETWTWSNIPTGALSASTSFTATGHGIDPSGNDVTFPAVAGERASTTVNVSSTNVTITANQSLVISGKSITLTVTEINNGTSGVTLINPSVILTGGLSGNLTKTTQMGGSFAGDTNGDGKLDIGETWTWSNIPTGALSASTSYTATGHGIDPSGNDVTFPAVAGERATVAVTVIHPHTTLSLSSSATSLPAQGGNVTITITDLNDGDVPLFNSHIHFKFSPIPGGLPSPAGLQGVPGYYFLGNPILPGPLFNQVEIGTFIGESISPDGIMQVNETWTWQIVVHITQATGFEAIGNGYDPTGGYVNYPEFPTERALGQVTLLPLVPASTNLGIGFMIAAFVGATIYLGRRKMRKVS